MLLVAYEFIHIDFNYRLRKIEFLFFIFGDYSSIESFNGISFLILFVLQKKKYEEKVEKLRKEVESTKHKYEQSLDDINSYNSHYIEDMKSVKKTPFSVNYKIKLNFFFTLKKVYKKCDLFEKTRLDFFIERFQQIHQILDMSKKEAINDIYADFMKTIRDANPDKDLLLWSKNNGSAMNMNWPVFEEYSEEFKTIARGSKASKITREDESGVTMTSIRQKEETSSISGLR